MQSHTGRSDRVRETDAGRSPGPRQQSPSSRTAETNAGIQRDIEMSEAVGAGGKESLQCSGGQLKLIGCEQTGGTRARS